MHRQKNFPVRADDEGAAEGGGRRRQAVLVEDDRARRVPEHLSAKIDIAPELLQILCTFRRSPRRADQGDNHPRLVFELFDNAVLKVRDRGRTSRSARSEEVEEDQLVASVLQVESTRT